MSIKISLIFHSRPIKIIAIPTASVIKIIPRESNHELVPSLSQYAVKTVALFERQEGIFQCSQSMLIGSLSCNIEFPQSYHFNASFTAFIVIG